MSLYTSASEKTPQQIPAAADGFLNWCVALKSSTDDMAKYLKRNQMLKAFYTFCELLTIFKELILKDENFDPDNPAIILADPELEKALGQQALSVKEIRNVIIKHVKLAEPGPAFRPTLCFSNTEKKSVVGTPIIYLDISGKTYDAYLFTPELIPHANYSGPITNELLKATMVNGFCVQFAKNEDQTLCSVKCLTIALTDLELTNFFILSSKIQARAALGKMTENKSLDQARQPHLSNYNYPPEIQNRPAVPTPKFLTLLQRVSGESKRKLFTYREAFKLINSYILNKQEELFAANSLIIIVENDPLGEIFQLKAFHQSQLGELIHACLSPLKDGEDGSVKTKVPKMGLPNLNPTGTPHAKQRCFVCKKSIGKGVVFCLSCWQIRRRKVGRSFQPPKNKKKQPPKKDKPTNNRKLKKDADLCKICFHNEARAGFLHGQTFHHFGCLNCCREIYLTSDSCPLCRRPIEKIILKYDS